MAPGGLIEKELTHAVIGAFSREHAVLVIYKGEQIGVQRMDMPVMQYPRYPTHQSDLFHR